MVPAHVCHVLHSGFSFAPPSTEVCYHTTEPIGKKISATLHNNWRTYGKQWRGFL